MVRALTLTLTLTLLGCGSSAAPSCPPCPASYACDMRTGVCVGFRTPLLDAATPDASTSDARHD